jgi:hypothetical protein
MRVVPFLYCYFGLGVHKCMYGKHEVGGDGTRPVWYGNFSYCAVHNAGMAPSMFRKVLYGYLDCIRHHLDLNTINTLAQTLLIPL